MGETYNPIGKSGAYDNKFFSRIPVPEQGYANVLTCGQNEYAPMVIQSGNIPRKEQISRGKYSLITEIDVRPHRISFDAELPARDNISHFILNVDMMARVEDPGRVCSDNITDVTAVVKSAILPELYARAIRYDMDDIQLLREDIDDWLKRTILSETGIQLTNIHVNLMPDRAYIERKKTLRASAETQEDKQRELQEKIEYERGRAMVAAELGRLYNDDLRAVYAELATGEITPEEAARRIEQKRKSQVAEGFDEKMRQMREVIDLAKMMRENDIGSPDIMGQNIGQLFGAFLGLTGQSISGGSTVPELAEAGLGQADAGLYDPPSDD